MPTNDSGFAPLHSGHAIEQVAMALSFDKDISDDGLTAIRDAIGKPEELPGRTQIRGLSFQIGPSPSVSTPAIAGYGFTKVRPDGMLETELHVQRSTVSFRTLFYTRWTNVWSHAKRYFDLALPTYLRQGAKLTQISLNYVDKFITHANVEDCRPADILRRDSPYLCSSVFLANDLWHSHCGRFERRNSTTKRLTTVNVDFISENVQGDDRRTVAITSVVADFFNQAAYDSLDLPVEKAARLIDETYHELHAADKDVIRSIISDRMSRRIALGS